MYCAAFIWEPGTVDAEFHRLNELIEQVALALLGILGVEPWQNGDVNFPHITPNRRERTGG